ncbi:MAG TPA: hypothetical protein VF630_05960 [Hymenobacter sp.]
MPDASLAVLVRIDIGENRAVENGAWWWKGYLKWCYNPQGLRQASGLEALAPQASRLVCLAQYAADGTLQLYETDVAAIAGHQLDFVLSFAEAPVSGAIAQATRHGVWAFQWGAHSAAVHQAIGMEETRQGQPVTTASLCRLSSSGTATVLKQGVFRTALHSPAATADRLYTECAHWPAELGQQLLAGAAVTASAAAPAATPAARPALPVFLARLAQHKLRDLCDTFLQADQWNMGVVDRPVQDFLRPENLRGAAVDAPLLPDRHVFYADCFARQEASGSVVYFERYDYRVRRGTIARLAYPWPAHEEPRDVLSFPFHLSYPFLHGPYCIPEAWITNGVRMYDLRKPVTDPAEGQLLLSVQGVDTTLLEHEGRYWLFYARMDRDPMLNLFISYADTLDGPWHDHPQNPVKTDVRGARPAGPFFKEGPRLYRPGQDCALDYGHGITVYEVLTLTPTDYAEREVARLTSPHPDYPDGLHTIAALDDNRTLLDFKRRRFIPFATLSALWKPVSALLYGKQGRRKPPVVASATAASQGC